MRPLTPHPATPLRPAPLRRRQRGAVLIFGLVVLLVVTMVGISGQQGTILQERMAGNMRQHNIALQAAEAALQVGLTYVEDKHPITATDSGAAHVWTPCTVADAEAGADPTQGTGSTRCTRFGDVLANWRGSLDDLKAGAAYAVVAALTDAGTANDIEGVAAQPRLYIEMREHRDGIGLDAQEGSDPDNVDFYYTVTAVGFGGNAQTRAIVQSTIVKP
jgi:type IV pilus assembly protein PilX